MTATGASIRHASLRVVGGSRVKAGLYQTCLSKPVHDVLEIIGVLVRQNLAAMFQIIVSVDTEHFLPFLARLREAAQMTIARRQKHA